MWQSKKYQRLNLIIGLILVLGLGAVVVFNKMSNPNNNLSSLIETVSAQEIYSLFICSCCGKTIDAGCCGMAQERKAYVDGLIQGNLNKDEIIISYVRKYGLDSFKDEAQKEEFRKKLVEQAPAERPIISLSPDIYDFGEVSQKEGIKTTFFEIKNDGKGDLIIERLETSCGCTFAAVVYQGEEGPKFGMPGHGLNEEIGDWQIIISAGQTAQLKVYYDPDVHPDFRGTAIREIYVYSNDPIDFEKKVKIELNQVD